MHNDPLPGLRDGALWGAFGGFLPLAFWLGLGGPSDPDAGAESVAHFKFVLPVIPASAAIGAMTGLIGGSLKRARPVYTAPELESE